VSARLVVADIAARYAVEALRSTIARWQSRATAMSKVTAEWHRTQDAAIHCHCHIRPAVLAAPLAFIAPPQSPARLTQLFTCWWATVIAKLTYGAPSWATGRAFARRTTVGLRDWKHSYVAPSDTDTVLKTLQQLVTCFLQLRWISVQACPPKRTTRTLAVTAC